MCKGMTVKVFKDSIISAFGERVKNVFFTGTRDVYYADYRPKYPERTAGDFLISYDWLNGKLKMTGVTGTLPTIREFGSLEELTEAIRNMDY